MRPYGAIAKKFSPARDKVERLRLAIHRDHREKLGYQAPAG
jgi:hypothetical protein